MSEKSNNPPSSNQTTSTHGKSNNTLNSRHVSDTQQNGKYLHYPQQNYGFNRDENMYPSQLYNDMRSGYGNQGIHGYPNPGLFQQQYMYPGAGYNPHWIPPSNYPNRQNNINPHAKPANHPSLPSAPSSSAHISTSNAFSTLEKPNVSNIVPFNVGPSTTTAQTTIDTTSIVSNQPSLATNDNTAVSTPKFDTPASQISEPIETPSSKSADYSHLANTKVAVITNNDVRYIGTLDNIDKARKSIKLINVQCLGTEDRQGSHDFVPISSEILAYLVLDASNLKSMKRFSDQSTYVDPAVLQVGAALPKTESSKLDDFFDNLNEPMREKKFIKKRHNNNNNNNGKRHDKSQNERSFKSNNQIPRKQKAISFTKAQNMGHDTDESENIEELSGFYDDLHITVNKNPNRKPQHNQRPQSQHNTNKVHNTNKGPKQYKKIFDQFSQDD